MIWQNIENTWDEINLNMHKYSVYVLGSAEAKYGLLHGGFINLKNLYICQLATIAKKYNLTILEYKRKHQTSLADRNFGIFKYSSPINLQPDDYVYRVRFVSINFITISNTPSITNGVINLVYPLDWESWTCLFFVIVSCAGFFTYADSVGSSNVSLNDRATNVVDNVIVVTCVLLGQVGKSMQKAYQRGSGAFLILTLWVFGSFVLMINLY